MKTLIKTILILITINIIYSCTKEPKLPKEITKTLTGRLVKNCAGDPLKNYPVDLLIRYSVWDKDNFDYNGKTDSNGYFTWKFTVKDKPHNIKIRPAGRADILTIDSDDPEILGTIIATPTCNVVMKIKVNNPYSVGDTLQLKDFTDYNNLKGIRIGAPFKDTVLSVAYDYAELSWPLSFEQKNTTYVETYIYIYKGASVLYDRDIETRFKSCTGKIDTLLVEIN